MAQTMVPESEKFKKVNRLKKAGDIISIHGSIPGYGASKGDVVNVDVTAHDGQHRKSSRSKRSLPKAARGRYSPRALRDM